MAGEFHRSGRSGAWESKIGMSIFGDVWLVLRGLGALVTPCHFVKLAGGMRDAVRSTLRKI